MKALYLGIDPSRWMEKVFHYPVIRTELIEQRECPPETTHLIFTSRSAVRYWNDFAGKQILAIGEATAALLREKGIEPLVAPEATQEGVMALLDVLDLSGANLLWPRSDRSRNDLALYLKQKNIPFRAIDLYRTVFQKPEPVPSLDDFDEIVFTSPSTVDGFLQIYGKLPRNKKLTAIGPVTRSYISENSKRCFMPVLS